MHRKAAELSQMVPCIKPVRTLMHYLRTEMFSDNSMLNAFVQTSR